MTMGRSTPTIRKNLMMMMGASGLPMFQRLLFRRRSHLRRSRRRRRRRRCSNHYECRHNVLRWGRASRRGGRASGGRPSSIKCVKMLMKWSGSRSPRSLIDWTSRTCGPLERRRTSWPRRRPCRRPGRMQQRRSRPVLRRRRAVRYGSRRRSQLRRRGWSRGRRHLLYKRRPRRLLFPPRRADGLPPRRPRPPLRRRGRRARSQERLDPSTSRRLGRIPFEARRRRVVEPAAPLPEVVGHVERRVVRPAVPAWM